MGEIEFGGIISILFRRFRTFPRRLTPRLPPITLLNLLKIINHPPQFPINRVQNKIPTTLRPPNPRRLLTLLGYRTTKDLQFLREGVVVDAVPERSRERSRERGASGGGEGFDGLDSAQAVFRIGMIIRRF